MSASRLSIYNDALLICGERALASLTENREPRHLLDQVWNSNGVDLCLEEAQWHFAMHSDRLVFDPDIEPDFGYRRAFLKPQDWVITSAVCSDEFFTVPLLRYVDERGYWYTDIDELYVRYVSKDAQYGLNLALWPRSFAEFVAAHFATKIAMKLAGNDGFAKAVKVREKTLLEAKNKSAMAEPTKFMPSGSWTQARQRNGQIRDGGNRGSLIG